MFIRKRERTANFYQELQERTLDRLQELSGDVWTDFNIHDPGVTISDNMNYALFELQYKLELPFQAFIGPDPTNYVDKGIFSGDFIFSQSIVTPEDYEQLFLTEIENLETCSVEFNDGYYVVQASVSPNNPLASTENIKEEIFVLFHENRNLCEDLRWDDIHLLTKSSGKKKKKSEEVSQIERVYDSEYPENPIKIQNYNSFQLDFPDAYGIGLRGLPQEASERNKAHVLQLKGYLLMMDFLLANTTEQIQNTPQLINFKEPPPAGVVSMVSIPEVNKVVDRAKFHKNNQLQTSDSIQNKKSGFLDILDTLYGEDTAQFFQDFQPPTSKIKYRSLLTEELPELNRNRFRSFNKLKPTESNIVFKELFSLLHGKKIESEIPVRDLLKNLGLDLLPDDVFFDQYEVYLDIAPISGVFYNPIFNETPQNVPVHEMDWKEEYFPSLQNEISLVRRNAIFESFLSLGSNAAHYRMIQLSENSRWILVFRYPGKEEWMIIGTYRTKEHLIRSANRLWALVRFLNPERHLFYLVEHRLLQYAYPEEEQETEGNTLSIIASSRFENQVINERLEELLRERLPAHLHIRIYRVDSDYIYDFEQIYYRWREALASRKTKDLVHFSESIRAFFRVSHSFLQTIQ
ncbi:hypothetical protein D3C87_17160 [compost metagenome]